MHIGIDAHSAEKDGTGNCTYTRNLILALARLYPDVSFTLFVTDPGHAFYRSLWESKNIATVAVRRSPALLRVFSAIPKAARKARVDLLHVQYFSHFGITPRTVNMIHDVAWMRLPEHFGRFERFLFNAFVPGSARRADFVLTTSKMSRNDIIALLKIQPERVKVTYNGVSDRFFAMETSVNYPFEVCARYGLTRNFLLYVGRIDPRKNLVRLIQAYTILRRKHSCDLQLAIAGKVYLEPHELHAALGNSEYSDDICFCGFVSDEDLPALYRAADAFVYPSEFEGFGLPPVEAMACGTPVVASNIPIFREILRDAAVLIDPHNVDDLAEGIHRVLSDRGLRKELVEKGKGRARDFTWDDTARRTMEVFRDMLGLQI